MRRPAPTGPAPLVVTPALVNQVAAQLNQLLHTNLPSNGLVTEDMKQALMALQRQLGISPTGFPDQKTLQGLRTALTHGVAKAKKATPIADAGNFVSKAFGGPPSSPSTGPDEGVRKAQQMLNTFFGHHVVDENGMMDSVMAGIITEFQTAQGLPKTGTIDSKTHDLLENLTSQGAALFSHRTGADSGDWKTETQSLGSAAQDIIAKVISEGNSRTMLSVSKLLKAAGFSQAAAATSAPSGSATSGWW